MFISKVSCAKVNPTIVPLRPAPSRAVAQKTHLVVHLHVAGRELWLPRGSREPHLIALVGRCQSARSVQYPRLDARLVDVALGRFDEVSAAARAQRANINEMMR